MSYYTIFKKAQVRIIDHGDRPIEAWVLAQGTVEAETPDEALETWVQRGGDYMVVEVKLLKKVKETVALSFEPLAPPSEIVLEEDLAGNVELRPDEPEAEG